MAAEGGVLLFQVNYCVFVKEELVSKSLKKKTNANSPALVLGHGWRGVSPHPRAHRDLLSAAAGPSGCRRVGYTPGPLPHRHQSPLLLTGPARPRIQPCGKSVKVETSYKSARKQHSAASSK